MNAVSKRPTETVTGIALAGSIYGFLTQAGVGQALAAIIAVVVAFLPAVISEVVDVVRKPDATVHTVSKSGVR